MDDKLLKELDRIGRTTGAKILKIYEGSFEVKKKADGSPITIADKLADEYITEELLKLEGNIPILTEEGKAWDFEQRSKWSEFWLVDPIDGTRSFTTGKGQFTVNIALIKDRRPVLGMVYAPLRDISYVGNAEKGMAWKRASGDTVQISTRDRQSDLAVLASKNHRTPRDDSFLERLKMQFPTMELLSESSSLKFCAIAEGKADLYSRFEHTYEWDLGAAHAVLLAAGGEIFNTDGSLFRFNKQNLLNDAFLGVGDTNKEWVEFLVELANR